MFIDQLNRIVQIKESPKRIVSLVPSITELLVDLGLKSSIVGITKFCEHPNYLRKEKTVVGGTKQVHFDTIKALRPDIILCNKEENTQDMISELEHIAPIHISDIYDFENALQLIEMYGALFSIEKKSKTLIEHIKKKKAVFDAFISSQPRLKVAYFIWKKPWMVAASHTFIDTMLSINNFENNFANLRRYPKISLNQIDKDVEVLLLSSEPFPFNNTHVNELKLQFPNTKIVLVDGDYFSWYGSRLVKAFDYFKTLRLNHLT